MSELSEIKWRYNNLIKQDRKPFPPPHTKLQAPLRKGVYIIRSPRGKVLHVGRTPRAKGGLHQRFNNHLSGHSSFVKEHFKGKGDKLRDGYTYQYVTVKYPRRRALLEYYAIGQLCPHHLGLGKAEKKAR